MDILMPEKEGIETILEIRRHHDSVKIVAMSGGGRVGDTEFLNIAKKIGADRSITKPFTRDQLMTALKGLV
jgi:CheY-like chemotaxis protein